MIKSRVAYLWYDTDPIDLFTEGTSSSGPQSCRLRETDGEKASAAT